ncbi:MAG: transposase [Bacteroidales bacterium]|nr:transposase [Bacteroidales bacterium]
MKRILKEVEKYRKKQAKEKLRDNRYVLLKNEENLTEKQRIKFDAIRQSNYEVSKAWEVREYFKDLFNKENNKEDAFILFM